MAKCVDFEDVKECVKYGITHGWSLQDFLESMDEWEDFAEGYKWHDAEMDPPEVDEDGCSDYVLLSFLNAQFFCIGQYRKAEDGGGAYYDGDDEDPLTKIGLYTEAWTKLPKERIEL